MTTYVWYSAGSKETGEFIAKAIGAEQHGVLPPKEFTGSVVCFGATPSDKFKWEERNFSGLFNDPRIVRNFVNRKKMFARLAEGGLIVPPVIDVSPEDTYASLVGKLGLNLGNIITVFSENGGHAVQVTNSYNYDQAKANAKLASGSDFGILDRTRVFVVNGMVIGGLKRSKNNTGVFVEKAVNDQNIIADKEKAAELIKHLLGSGYISQAKYFWAAHDGYSPAMVAAAVKAAGLLQYDLCAVDLVETAAGGVKVLNVVSTPDLVNYPNLHIALTNAVKGWVQNKVRSAKDILKELTEKSDEEEAAAIVAVLRDYKAKK